MIGTGFLMPWEAPVSQSLSYFFFFPPTLDTTNKALAVAASTTHGARADLSGLRPRAASST